MKGKSKKTPKLLGGATGLIKKTKKNLAEKSNMLKA